MSWYRIIIFYIFIFFIVGCANNQKIEIGKKAFEEEDNFIIKGILAEETNRTKAINIFQNLYKQTDKYVYLKKIIELYFTEKEYNKTIQLVDTYIKKYPNHNNIIKWKIYSYLKLNQIDTALKTMKKTLDKNRDLELYKIMAYLYLRKNNYQEAIKYLKSAYSISHSSAVLSEMGDIFFKYLKKPNEAISYYQTHIRLYGCDEKICKKLTNIYKFLYDYDNLIEMYKKLYYSTLKLEYATKIIFLYINQKEFQKGINFIKKEHLSKKLLIPLYKEKFRVEKKPEDAYKLFQLTNRVNYLFLSAVTKFEQSEKGLVDIKNLISTLYKVIEYERKPIYLNYLGYILIDYDIDPKEGVKFVEEALQIEPNSAYYLDSLAWGKYKLKECKEAYQIISKIKLDDEEVIKHKKMIRRCYDFRKNYSKNSKKFKKRETN